MTQLSQPELLARITFGLSASSAGYSVLEASKPFLVSLTNFSDVPEMPFRIFIWNITHGGKSRNPNEFRIQVTPAMPPPSNHEKVIVLGWHEELEVFAAWDPTAHSQRASTSPSLQVGFDKLQNASAAGVSAEVRGSGDSVIAFRPEYLAFYLGSASLIHELPVQDAAALFTTAANTTGEQREVEPERPLIERIVLSRFRDASFSARVRNAYEHHCAICGKQLALIEAAHILPVAVSGSTDETRNGIALCRNHHHAFDQGLIFITDDYKVHVNHSRLAELNSIGQDEGIESLLKAEGGSLLHLPDAAADRPHLPYLKTARSIRGIEA